jgi:hypothetical protein
MGSGFFAGIRQSKPMVDKFSICEDDCCIWFSESDGRETPNVTFNTFSRQWIYMLLRGPYRMLRKLCVTCAVSLIAGVASGGTVVTPSNIPTDSTGDNLTAPGGIVAGSPTGGNEGAATIDVATGHYIDENFTATCVGGPAKAINGISYSACYPGSSFDVRANACLADAVAQANGNNSGICDSTTEPTTVQQYGQITVGNGKSTVTWRLSAGLYSIVKLTGGTQYAVLQKAASSIICEGVQNSGCSFTNFSGTNGAYAMYGARGNGYVRMDGVFFKSLHGGTLASGHVAIIEAGYDGSSWTNNQWIDDQTTNVGNGTVAVVNAGTFCCHSNFTNNTFDSEWGQTALDIEETGYNQFNAVNFHNNTFNSHGPSANGNPNILCHDSNPGLRSMISFTGVTYMEGQSARMTAPFIQDNGCRALDFGGILEAYPLGRGDRSTSAIIDVSSAFDTTLNVGATVAYQGNSNNTWVYPVTIVEQHNVTADCGTPPCAVAATDSAGNSPGYHSRTSQFNNLTVGGNLVVKALQQSFTIAASTTVGYVMSMTTTADEVKAAGPGSTNNVGIATTVGGPNRKLYVATQGKILTVFDGTPVVGDFACAPPASTGTVGLAHDNGTTACPAGQKLGVVTGQVSGTGSGATATVLLEMGS